LQAAALAVLKAKAEISQLKGVLLGGRSLT